MPNLGVYWIVIIWCWIFVPHFIPKINEHPLELVYTQIGGLVWLAVVASMSMPEGHPHHMDLGGWLFIGSMALMVWFFTKLNLGG